MQTPAQDKPAAPELLNHVTEVVPTLRGNLSVQAVASNFHQVAGAPAIVALRINTTAGWMSIPLGIDAARGLARALLECAEVAEQHGQTERQALDAAIDLAIYDSAISDLVGLTP